MNNKESNDRIIGTQVKLIMLRAQFFENSKLIREIANEIVWLINNGHYYDDCFIDPVDVHPERILKPSHIGWLEITGCEGFFVTLYEGILAPINLIVVDDSGVTRTRFQIGAEIDSVEIPMVKALEKFNDEQNKLYEIQAYHIHRFYQL